MKQPILLTLLVTIVASSPFSFCSAPQEATLSISAKKIDTTIPEQTWSFIIYNKPELPRLMGAYLDKDGKVSTPWQRMSKPITDSVDNSTVYTNQPTYVFVFKNDRASGDPVRSVISAEQVTQAGEQPILVIAQDGTASIVSQKSYERMQKMPQACQGQRFCKKATPVPVPPTKVPPSPLMSPRAVPAGQESTRKELK